MTLGTRNAALAALCLIAVSCGSQTPASVPPTERPALFMPTHQFTASGPAALLDGTLVERDGCLWIETRERQRFLALWPTGYRVAAGSGTVTVLRNDGRPVAEVGRPITVGGGEYAPHQEAFVQGLIGRPIPDACRGNKYWLVGEVLPSSRSSRRA